MSFPFNIDNVKELPYDLRFRKLGLQKIIKDLFYIENQIIGDIILFSNKFFENNGAKVSGDILLYKDERIKIHVEFVKSERKLFINFLAINKPTLSTLSHQVEINGFGAIKSISFKYPYLIRKNFNYLIGMIIELVNFAYISLEKIFKTEFKTFGEYLFNNLYDILNIELERQNKKNLTGKAFFNVTIQSNKQFRYFFDHDNLNLIIDYLKLHQSYEFSPIEMLVSLMSEEADDTLNTLLIVEEGNFNHIQSYTFVSQENNLKFYSSETLLFDNKEMVTFTILKVNKLILQINCPKEIEKEFKPIFKITQSSLSLLFNENVKKYLQHVKELSKIPKPSLKSSISLKIADWLGTFTGSAIISMFKKMTKS